jgi:hypothetical protein
MVQRHILTAEGLLAVDLTVKSVLLQVRRFAQSLRVGSDEERRHSALQTTSSHSPCVWAQLLCSPCSADASLPVSHGGGSDSKHGQTELLIEALRAH